MSALVSMLSLETAMLEAFGDEGDEIFRRISFAKNHNCHCEGGNKGKKRVL